MQQPNSTLVANSAFDNNNYSSDSSFSTFNIDNNTNYSPKENIIRNTNKNFHNNQKSDNTNKYTEYFPKY